MNDEKVRSGSPTNSILSNALEAVIGTDAMPNVGAWRLCHHHH